jgi:hypothetical protein
MIRRCDLTGQKFGKLTVLEHVPERSDRGGKRFWWCVCDCGNQVMVRADNLKSGHSTQCIQCAYGARRKIKKKVVKKVVLGR